MASYLDLIPKFREYVPETPPEVVAQVGVYKQQKYEENVQKIQDQLEKVAGLDIIRDIDKKYLQSKLDEVGGNLRMFAAGDFSNFQLVNSVSGMTKQIVNDKNIQAAVGSTAWYRKQVSSMEKARADGKSSISNEWDFNEKANKYISSSDLGVSFKDVFTPYTDTKKKAMDAIKALHPKLQSIDIPYVIRPDGSIDTRKIADAMTRNKIEGIDEGQIKQAIYSSLTPDDMNQMSIDGRYQFRNITGNMLAEKAKNDYFSQRNDAVNTLSYLKQKRQITNNPNIVDQIDKQINYYETLVGKDGNGGDLYEQAKQNIQNAIDNPDEVKFSMYKDGFVKEFANAFSWKNEEKQLLTNPIKQQENWVAEQREKIREFDINKSFQQANLDIARAHLAIAQRDSDLKAMEVALKKAELYGDPLATDWTPLVDPTTDKNESENIFAKIVTKIDNGVKGEMQKLKDQGYTDDQIKLMVNDYKINGNKASSVPARAIGTLQSILKGQNKLEALHAKEDQLKAEADREIRKNVSNATALTQADEFVKSINEGKPLNLAKGVTLTAKEIGDKLLSGKAIVQDIGFGNLAYTDKETGMVIKIPSTENGLYRPKGGLFDNFQKIIEYRKNKQAVFNKGNDLYREKLATIISDYIPQMKAVTSGKDGAPPPVVIQRLSALATSADFNNIAADENTNLETTSKFLSDKYNKDTRVFIKQSGDDYEVIIKNEQDPKNIQTIKLNRGESDILRYFGEGYTNPRTFESLNIKLGKGNTNVTSNPENAMIQKQFGDLPNINRLQVTADLQQDLNNPDLYIPMINVRKKDGRYQNFEIVGYDKKSRLGFEQAKTQINSLDDNGLLNLLKAQYPNYDFSQLDY